MNPKQAEKGKKITKTRELANETKSKKPREN